MNGETVSLITMTPMPQTVTPLVIASSPAGVYGRVFVFFTSV